MSEQSERILVAIENSRLSYAELEKRTGIPKSTIQRYAKGVTKKIPIEVVTQIAKATGVSDAWIVGWVDEKAEKKNDIIADIILRLRTDENFLAVVSDLYNISDEQLSAVKTMLNAFKE